MLWKVSKGRQGQPVWEYQNKEGKSDGIAVVIAKVRARAEQHLPRTLREVEFVVTSEMPYGNDDDDDDEHGNDSQINK